MNTRELRDKIGTGSFNAIIKHPYYKEHIASSYHDPEFHHETTSSGSHSTIKAHIPFGGKKKTITFQYHKNKVYNAHYALDDKHIRSHKEVKESMENINELSAKTIQSYLNKLKAKKRAETEKKEVSEAKIGDKVTVTHGSQKGLVGHVGEIRKGLGGKDHTYTVDYDDNGKRSSVQVKKAHTKVVKESTVDVGDIEKKKAITPSDKATIGKVADLMKKEKEKKETIDELNQMTLSRYGATARVKAMNKNDPKQKQRAIGTQRAYSKLSRGDYSEETIYEVSKQVLRKYLDKTVDPVHGMPRSADKLPQRMKGIERASKKVMKEANDELNKKTPSEDDIMKKHGLNKTELDHHLAIGIKTEMEHTKNAAVAREIALDHINEKPDYYAKLKKVVEDVSEASNYSSYMARGKSGMVGKKPNASDMASYGTYNVTVKHSEGEKTYKLKNMKDSRHAQNVAMKIHSKDNPSHKISTASADKVEVKEETINEVSKKVLGRYIEKAATSMSSAAFGQGQASASRRPPREQDQKTGMKRMTGIARATSKLTKEETAKPERDGKKRSREAYISKKNSEEHRTHLGIHEAKASSPHEVSLQLKHPQLDGVSRKIVKVNATSPNHAVEILDKHYSARGFKVHKVDYSKPHMLKAPPSREEVAKEESKKEDDKIKKIAKAVKGAMK